MVKVFCLAFAAAFALYGQTAALRGVVTDETGAVIPGVDVVVAGPGGNRSAKTGTSGSYLINGLRPGEYTVQASTADLELPQAARISLNVGVNTLDLQLRLATVQQQITVDGADASTVSTDVSSNASATTLQGKDLDALSDDPEDLQADLQALAGPGAGPGGSTVFVDGFSEGGIPPKESIKEIRINQNPFSPEYDHVGLGHIEIVTKPGADKLRGTVSYNHMDESLNSRNPYASQKATLRLNEFRTNLSGSLNQRASFTLDASRDAVDNGAIVKGVLLDPQSLLPTPFSAVPTIPQRRSQFGPRMDYQINPKNTLTLLYNIIHTDLRGVGIGGFDLPERGYHTRNTYQVARATESLVLGTVLNETRFQFYRAASEIDPGLNSPTLQVLGSFNSGGPQPSFVFNTQNSYELQNYTTAIRGSHVVKFGMRARFTQVDRASRQNYNGTFTFAGGTAPVLDANNQPALDASGQPVLAEIQSIERYRRTLLFQQLGMPAARIRALGGGATQFTLTAGIPEISGTQADVGLFVGDDWKLRPNLTLSLGARYEMQTNIPDHADWAPRAGLVWAPGGTGKKQPKAVLRAGFGLFYDRFGLYNTLTARLYDGNHQQQFLVTNPDFFPTIPVLPTLAGLRSRQVLQVVDPNFRSPYAMQSMVSLERQLPARTTVALTYTAARGVHTLRSLDINAPLPGSGLFPLGGADPLFQMAGAGVFKQNQVTVNVNSRVNRRVSMTGFYTWNKARSNTDGLGTFPANPYDHTGEYGPAAYDIRHTANAGGSIETKWNIRLNPLVTLQSGPPFNITTGSDLYGTTLFNSRPALATGEPRAGLIQTSYGLLDPSPSVGEMILGRNAGRGPGQIMVNLRVTKTIPFGPVTKGSKSGDHRYSLAIALSVRNVLNHTNPGPIIGNITSPLFGQANQIAGSGGGFSENASNRRLEWQTRFSF